MLNRNSDVCVCVCDVDIDYEYIFRAQNTDVYMYIFSVRVYVCERLHPDLGWDHKQNVRMCLLARTCMHEEIDRPRRRAWNSYLSCLKLESYVALASSFFASAILRTAFMKSSCTQ